MTNQPQGPGCLSCALDDGPCDCDKDCGARVCLGGVRAADVPELRPMRVRWWPRRRQGRHARPRNAA